MASASFGSRRPVSLCVSAAAFLIHTCVMTNGRRGGDPLIGKFAFAGTVWTPYRALAGTSLVPSGSFSVRVAVDIEVDVGRGFESDAPRNHRVIGTSSACAKRLKKLYIEITAVISMICVAFQCDASVSNTGAPTMPGVGVIASAYANAARHGSSNTAYWPRATASSCSSVAPCRLAKAVWEASQ